MHNGNAGGGASSSSRQLSVVVGSVESSRSIGSCLDALARGCSGIDAEIIVVDAGDNETVSRAVGSLPGASLIAMPADTLAPRLWSEGLAASSGEIVAFTTGHCFVENAWAASMLAALRTGAAAAGGPLRLERDASVVDAATFFLRYSAYLEGRADGDTDDVAGDNSAYVRRRIPEGSWTREDGFWEHDVNRAIRAAGFTIRWSGGAVAEFGRSFGLGSICRHRFAHGRLFGIARVTRGEAAVRIVLASPFVPFVMALRAGRRSMRRAEYRLRFAAALPLILVIAFCWAAGEAAGALESTVADRR